MKRRAFFPSERTRRRRTWARERGRLLIAIPMFFPDVDPLRFLQSFIEFTRNLLSWIDGFVAAWGEICAAVLGTSAPALEA